MTAAITLPTEPEAELRAILAASEGRWEKLARPEQKEPPGKWRVWLIRSGRGAGKTRCGSEWIKQRVASGARRIALVAETAADARDVMVEGNSGILSLYPPAIRPVYEPSKRRITWPCGAVATTYAGDAPDQLRGPEHDTVWCDELAKFDYAPECWDNVQFGCRIISGGLIPRVLVTTTPRPLPVLRDMIADPDTVETRTSTFENEKNLDRHTLQYLKRRYANTRIGRQELEGEILDDVEGAIVTLGMIDAGRVSGSLPSLSRIVVGVDPAAKSGEQSDLTGIVVCGADETREHGYVLADRSGRMSPEQWARRAIEAYHEFNADCIVAEVNNGGEMVAHTIRMVDRNVRVKTVHATRGKHVRFEPVGALYEQGRMHHVGTYAELEDQVRFFTPQGYEGGDSPDRADALVWAATDVVVTGGATMSQVLDIMEASNRRPEPDRPEPKSEPAIADRLSALFGGGDGPA